MKKIICLFMVLFCLCSCKATETEPKLLGISFDGELSYYNEEYSFEAEFLEDKTLVLSVMEPEELKDLKITVTNDNMKADYKGLIYEANEATMPFSRVIMDFYSPLVSLASDNSLKANKDGEISAEFEEKKYTLIISPTGLPQSFEIKDKQLMLKFYNVSIKEE